MKIKRNGTTKRWSDTVISNNILYMVEVANKTINGSILEQTREILDSIEIQLQKNGSSKSNLLMVTIYLADIRDIEVFNQIWDEWLPNGSAPVRACVEVKLANANFKVELQVIAACENN